MIDYDRMNEINNGIRFRWESGVPFSKNACAAHTWRGTWKGYKVTVVAYQLGLRRWSCRTIVVAPDGTEIHQEQGVSMFPRDVVRDQAYDTLREEITEHVYALEVAG